MKNSIKKPNILFIITDDQGEWAVESEKNRDIRGIIRMCEQVAASGNTLILYSA